MEAKTLPEPVDGVRGHFILDEKKTADELAANAVIQGGGDGKGQPYTHGCVK